VTVDLIVHGHFYQPPRENPWSGVIDRERSAAPYHDWNERIHAECYRPNCVARVLDERGDVLRLVDNHALVSFDYGPTLLSWLERAHPDTYARILRADAASAARLGGHGNAIAHGYNHAILPLCSPRDRDTQIRWGIADFRARFGRDPEALWLPETACDEATLGALADHGLRYAILSPYQARRVRPLPGGGPDAARTGAAGAGGRPAVADADGQDTVAADAGRADAAWRDVSGGRIDPGVPYLWRGPGGRALALFFYDGPIARGIAFEGLLGSSAALVSRFELAAGGGAGPRGGGGAGPSGEAGGRGGSRCVNVATDGESYGHHHRGGERGLAYALAYEAPRRGFHVTNYGEHLARNPPRFEVELEPGPNGEGTAWSCAHGLGRWTRDCGCSTGGQPGWSQAWRGPLRTAMDVVRDATAAALDRDGADVLVDPWRARDAWIDVLLRRRTPEALLEGEGRPGVAGDRARATRALALLEASRHAMLAYTSCGWFFADVSGIETRQVMRYAARALDLLERAGLDAPRARVLEALGEARSNLRSEGTGADVWRRYVEPSRVTRATVAASFAIRTAVAATQVQESMTGAEGTLRWHARQVQRRVRGALALVTARVAVEAWPLGPRGELAVAALYLGGVDVTCAVRPAPSDEEFAAAVERVGRVFREGNVPRMIHAVHGAFAPPRRIGGPGSSAGAGAAAVPATALPTGPGGAPSAVDARAPADDGDGHDLEEYGLESVLDGERERIAHSVLAAIAERATADALRIYDEAGRAIDSLHHAGFPLPPEVAAVAEFAVARRFEAAVERGLASGAAAPDPSALAEARALAREADSRGLRIDRARVAAALGARLLDAVERLVARGGPLDAEAALVLVREAEALGVPLDVDRAQELLVERFEAGTPLPEQARALAHALRLSAYVTDRAVPAAPHEPRGREGAPRP
jgi:alpha-amylase/alpha-mannosidase (GH57 family)